MGPSSTRLVAILQILGRYLHKWKSSGITKHDPNHRLHYPNKGELALSIVDSPVKSSASGLATPDEVAEYLHTTPATLSQDRYHHRGVPYIKHGRKVLYRWSDVYAYLEANTVNPQGVA
ncbi:UNVERIFIED_ORG: hypothetical protein L601_000800000490 [Gordonia westfalica J30]